MNNHFIFTSESVTQGHPDKLCDQISDAVVDHFLTLEPFARVRCECAIAGAIVFIAARFASGVTVDFTHLARRVIKQVGYDQPDFNPKNCSILISPTAKEAKEADRLDERSLTGDELNRIQANKQVTVFGYAVNESPVLMPLPIYLANRLTRQYSLTRRTAGLPYLMPDAKVQVGVEYHEKKPQRIHSITFEVHTRNAGKPDNDTLTNDLLENIIQPVFEDQAIRPDQETRIIVNPDGPYLGGPLHHSGLTGRKNTVDTYGEYTRNNGKALSGKDPLQIERLGAYAARYTAKNIVAAQLAETCEVMVSYGAGLAGPVSLLVNSFGTGRVSDKELTDLVCETFEFRLAGILKAFELRHLPGRHREGFFQKLSSYGHFGREDLELPWEKTDMTDQLQGKLE